MLHEWIRVWFGWVETWGYAGVFILMVLESTIVPVPSEIVVPPAAFWAAQGRMSFSGVLLAGTAGSLVGSIANYWVSQWVGYPILKRYGKYVLLPEDKLEMSARWVERFGAPGVLVARFLPVVRHLISIPAGVLKMPFLPFVSATAIGAGLWCGALAWFGAQVIGDHPELLQSPEQMMAVMKSKLIWIVAGVLAMGVLYAAVLVFKKRTAPQTVP